jgi:hypothetical protein
MVKTIRTISTALVLMSASTIALAGETGAGCGVGKVVMEGKSGKNAQITASIINLVANYFTGAQLFGMTSGTLGCDTTQQVSNEYAKEKFMASNQDNISIEMARGEGEHLTSLASIIGIQENDRPVFYSALQSNYETIVMSDDMLASIDSTMQGNMQLAKYVE